MGQGDQNCKEKKKRPKWFWFAWSPSLLGDEAIGKEKTFFLSISNKEISHKRRGIKQNKKESGHLQHKKKSPA